MNAGGVAALTIDAAGTLLRPAEAVAEVYARATRTHGVSVDAATVARRFGPAMRAARPRRRYDPTWRDFWADVIAASTGCSMPALLDDLYAHYARASAWSIAAGAVACIDALRGAGLRVAVLSNWHLRLRPLLGALGLLDRLDALVVSSECGLEKPDPRIFHHAARELGVDVASLLHVGDDDGDDLVGAREAGARAWQIDAVGGFAGVTARVLG